jgi:hypothetical protein
MFCWGQNKKESGTQPSKIECLRVYAHSCFALWGKTGREHTSAQLATKEGISKKYTSGKCLKYV